MGGWPRRQNGGRREDVVKGDDNGRHTQVYKTHYLKSETGAESMTTEKALKQMCEHDIHVVSLLQTHAYMI